MCSVWFCMSLGGLLDIGSLEASFKNRETPVNKSQPNHCKQTLRNQAQRERKILSHGRRDRVTKVMWTWCPWERKGFRGDVSSRNHSERKIPGWPEGPAPSRQKEFAMAISLFPASPILLRNLFNINFYFWVLEGEVGAASSGSQQADRTGKAANAGASYAVPHTFVQTCLQLLSRGFSPASQLAASKPHHHYYQPHITLQKPAGNNSRAGICTRLQ